MRRNFRCAVCESGNKSHELFLCRRCVHPMRVRTYCTRCNRRMDLTVLQARSLFTRAGLRLDRGGLVLRFTGRCPLCAPDTHQTPEIFEINQPLDTACQVASH